MNDWITSIAKQQRKQRWKDRGFNLLVVGVGLGIAAWIDAKVAGLFSWLVRIDYGELAAVLFR